MVKYQNLSDLVQSLINKIVKKEADLKFPAEDEADKSAEDKLDWNERRVDFWHSRQDEIANDAPLVEKLIRDFGKEVEAKGGTSMVLVPRELDAYRKESGAASRAK